jgi:hypothetical protein
MGIILSILKEYETDPLGKCCHGRDRNNICQEDFSMEILETEKRTYTLFRTLLGLCYISYYFILLHFLKIYPTLIINGLYLYGTKMPPQFE